MSESPAARRAALVQLLLAFAALLLLPLGLRAANRAHRPAERLPPYLPALGGPRERHPFDADRVIELTRTRPGYVVIGDSMAASRIDPELMSRVTGELVTALEYPGTGSAWWYLVLKNWVIASRIHPRCVFIFFRDTNLTNVLFRVDASWALDIAAHMREDELNTVISRRQSGAFHRLRTALDRLYGASEARRWIEPVVNEWPAWAMVRSTSDREDFVIRVNDRFALVHLRPMEAADMQAAEDRDADFDGYVDKSVLPLLLRDAGRASLKLCFIRVRRRPAGGHAPIQSIAMQRYAARLKAYIEERGAVFIDDTWDEAESLDQYADGDHLSPAGQRRYTERFAARVRQLFP